jgi:hypothetical protein
VRNRRGPATVMAMKAATSHCPKTKSKDGKARRVDKGLSQETYLEHFNRPLRRREKGCSIFPVDFLEAAERISCD